MNALVFLQKRVLQEALPGRFNAVRADEEINVPVVLPREEVAARISLLGAPAQLVAKLLRQRAAHYESQLVGHNDVATTMISTHLLQRGGRGVPSPLDDLGA